jgi:hypothetical protein
MSAIVTRLICLGAVATAAIALAACGGSKPPAPGSPEKPLVAEQTRLGGAGAGAGAGAGGRSNEAAAPTPPAKPGYDSLLNGQSRHPRSRFTPCNLVTVAQARTILGAPMLQPVEAPLGPTCIYRSRDRRSMVTVAVQALDFTKLEPRIQRRRRVAVGSRTAYCGTYGQPMLYVRLSGNRVLSIAAQCTVAQRFALKAIRQLPA